MTSSRARAKAPAPLHLLSGALLTACSASPAPAPTIDIAVPASAAAATSSEPEPAAPPICPRGMVFLAGGDLRTGLRLHVADVCIDVTEVTAAAYTTCVEHNLCTSDDLACEDATTWSHPALADHPINCVSWKQAERYCRAYGKRLPTHEEWEWAAQGRDEGRRFAWGADEPTGETLCWSRDNAREGTCAVGSFEASRSPQGVDDLFGGVWEWLAPEERDGSPNVARGGSWQNDSLEVIEEEGGGAFQPGFVRNDVVGFRCAADPFRP